MIRVEFFSAYEIAELFASLIGIPGFGRFIVSLSILIGGLLGGTGALVGISFIELVQEFRSGNKKEEENLSNQVFSRFPRKSTFFFMEKFLK